MKILPKKTNTQSENKINPVDWTAATATGLSTALGFYAFNASLNSKSTFGMLFHGAVGLFACKFAYGFGSAWKKNTKATTQEQYLKTSLNEAEQIQELSLKCTQSLALSLLSNNPKKHHSRAYTSKT